jgi:hypothetical protein
MSKSNTHENDYLKLILWGTAIVNIADNASSSPLTNLYGALHTADPTDAGDQESYECAYTPYARQAISRTSGGFSISGNVANLAAVVSFPECTVGSEAASYFSLGTAASGAGTILWSGAITPTITISAGIIPQLGTGTTITED